MDLLEQIHLYKNNPSNKTSLESLRNARLDLSRQLLSSPPWKISSQFSTSLGKYHHALVNSGIIYEPFSDIDSDMVNKIFSYFALGMKQPESVQYLLCAMLYVRADQLPRQWYKNATTPDWLLPYYLSYLFAAPHIFSEVGEMNKYFLYWKDLIDEIHHFLQSDEKYQRKQILANAFLNSYMSIIPLYFCKGDLKAFYAKRVKIVQYLLNMSNCTLRHDFRDNSIDTRSKTRIGILCHHIGSYTEMYAVLPVFEYLDRNEFEVYLYALYENNHPNDPMENHCLHCSDKILILPENTNQKTSLEQKAQAIQSDNLDILFIATNITPGTAIVNALAMHRLAKTQITSITSPVSTCMPSVDYYIGGEYTTPAPDAQEYYSEKLVNLPGSGICFSFPISNTQQNMVHKPQVQKQMNNSVIYISGANFFKIIPELRILWAKILSEVPNSTLVLYPFNPNWSNQYPARIFTRQIHEVFSQHGVSSDRLTILKPMISRNDIIAQLKQADVYLDSYPYGGATSLIDPLEAGLPPITMEGSELRFRQAPALLRDIGLHDLITNCEKAYLQLAVRLGTDKLFRNRHKDRLIEAMEKMPLFLNSRQYSSNIADAFKQILAKR